MLGTFQELGPVAPCLLHLQPEWPQSLEQEESCFSSLALAQPPFLGWDPSVFCEGKSGPRKLLLHSIGKQRDIEWLQHQSEWRSSSLPVPQEPSLPCVEQLRCHCPQSWTLVSLAWLLPGHKVIKVEFQSQFQWDSFCEDNCSWTQSGLGVIMVSVDY